MPGIDAFSIDLTKFQPLLILNPIATTVEAVRMKKVGIFLLGLLFVQCLYADAESFSAATSGLTANAMANLNASSGATTAQPQQVQNLLQMNLPGQIQQLQQSIQMLQGMVEIQGHQIQQLQNQLSQVTGKPVSQTPTETSAILQTPVVPLSSRAGAMSDSPVANLNLQNDLTPHQEQQMVTDSQNPPSSSSQSNSQSTDQTDSAADKALMQSVNNPAAQKEQQMYQSAYLDVQNKQYNQAIAGMKTYLDNYPAGQYAVNAHYWLGELYLVSGDNKNAVKEFNQVVNQTQNPAKVPDAMLKLGMIAMSNQDYSTAKQNFQTITKKYPDSSAAQIANQQLDTLSSAGY